MKLHTPRHGRAVLAALILLLAPSLWAAPAALAELQKTIADSTGLARRQAVRRLFDLGPEANAAILEMSKDADVVVRRNALRQLRGRLGLEAVPLYAAALADESPLVRLVALEELLAYQPRSEAVNAALMKATTDSDNEVRRRASAAFWTFHRDYLPLRRRPNWDHAIEVIARQALPLEGWLFRTDPGRSGHVQEWFAPKVDAAAWLPIVIGKWWHEALPEAVGNFEGVAWYRYEFTAPAKPAGEFNEAVLHFEAVDESTWVWVNGHYAGEHDLGTAGWNVAFDIEVGSFLTWGQANQIVVRVLNTAGAGGIYKPVEFQVLK